MRNLNPHSESEISYGEIAYNAFCEKQDWVFDESGTLMPPWDQLSEDEKDLFESTARAVLREKLKRSNPSNPSNP